MNAQDILRISRNAKCETETFINRYLNDRAKGWPRLCLAGPEVIAISDFESPARDALRRKIANRQSEIQL